ncbi:MAG: hypothetical protein R3A80_01165 [Bdellovibrionota bacterium]
MIKMNILENELINHPWVEGLKRKPFSIKASDFISLFSLFAPTILFVFCLLFFVPHKLLFSYSEYPWQVWAMIISGSIALLGGILDWLFHRLFFTVGPAEHLSHILAMASGGFPLFCLMILSSLSKNPSVFLIPTIVFALYTSVLISYDEFVFHRKRCRAIETLFHRMLVFGKTVAWLSWMHWCFVK